MMSEEQDKQTKQAKIRIRESNSVSKLRFHPLKVGFGEYDSVALLQWNMTNSDRIHLEINTFIAFPRTPSRSYSHFAL